MQTLRKGFELRKRTLQEWANFLHMFVAVDEDKTVWAFDSKPKIDLEEKTWIPRKLCDYFSIQDDVCHFDGVWDLSLKIPETNEYEVAIDEIFEFSGELYKCVESKLHSCVDCHFNNDKSLCVGTPECLGSVRTDRTDVIFEKI